MMHWNSLGTVWLAVSGFGFKVFCLLLKTDTYMHILVTGVKVKGNPKSLSIEIFFLKFFSVRSIFQFPASPLISSPIIMLALYLPYAISHYLCVFIC